MTDFVTLSCPTCGGKLSISKSVNQFACAHCGNEHIVRREGGTVSLDPIADSLENIKKGTDKTASELAIKRLQEEIKGLEYNFDNFLTENWKEQGILDSFLGRNVPYGQWFYMYCRKVVRRNGRKAPGDYDPDTIKDMTTGEVLEAISATSSGRWKEHELAGILAFAEKMLDYKQKIETKNQQLRKHSDLVNI